MAFMFAVALTGSRIKCVSYKKRNEATVHFGIYFICIYNTINIKPYVYLLYNIDNASLYAYSIHCDAATTTAMAKWKGKIHPPPWCYSY